MDTELEATVYGLLTQSYAIFFATSSSINQKQFGLYDTHFALLVTASPFIMQLLYASILDLLGYKNRLYTRELGSITGILVY